MKVCWVIMGNDFPLCVFDNEEEAKKCVAVLKAVEDAKDKFDAKIYWRSYELKFLSEYVPNEDFIS